MTLKEYVHEILECDYSVTESFHRDPMDHQVPFMANISGHWEVVKPGTLKGVVGFGETREEALQDLVDDIKGQKITNDGFASSRHEIRVPSSLTVE